MSSHLTTSAMINKLDQLFQKVDVQTRNEICNRLALERDYWSVEKTDGIRLLTQSIDSFSVDYPAISALEPEELKLLKEVIVNEVFGLACLDFFLPLNDWSIIRITNNRTLQFLDVDGHVEILDFAFRLDRFPTILAERFAVQLEIRMNHLEPLFERKWNEFIIAVVVPPMAATTAIQITRISDLMKRWPKTKLPS